MGMLLWMGLAAVVGRQGLPTQPIMQIDSRGHTAAVVGLASDANGKYLVTGSLDRTARVWALPSLRLLRVLRPPITKQPGDGQLQAVAISPDGAKVYAGGTTGETWEKHYSVYEFERATGRMLRKMGDLPSGIRSLALSPDGMRLAMGLNEGGLRVLSLESGDTEFVDKSDSSQLYGLSFDPSGRLAAAFNDGTIRLYGPDGSTLKSATQAGGGNPIGVSFSPDGSKLVVADGNQTSVSVLDGTTLASLQSLEASGLDKAVYAVAWSRDGRYVYASGEARLPRAQALRRWDLTRNGAHKDFALSDADTLALAALPRGRLAFGAWDGFGTLGEDGKTNTVPLDRANMVRIGGHFRVSETGDEVRFGFSRDGIHPADFSIANRALVDLDADPAPSAPLAAPSTSAAGLNLVTSPNSIRAELNGSELPECNSLAVSADGRLLVLGTRFYLRCVSTSDGQEAWTTPLPGPAFGVNVSGNGEIAVAALEDGTVRWYRMTDGHPLLTLYAHPDGHRWILWTPSGYYDCSAGGEDLAGWAVDSGIDHEAGFYPASRCRSKFYRPDVIAQVLVRRDVDAALQAADEQVAQTTGKAPDESLAVSDMLPPVVEKIDAIPDGRKVSLAISLTSQTAEPITSIDIFSGGILVKRADHLALDAHGSTVFQTTLEIADRGAPLVVMARNRYAASVAQEYRIPLGSTARGSAEVPPPTGETTPVQTQRERGSAIGGGSGALAHGKLWLLAVGVGKFTHDPTLNLYLPEKDATDFANVIRGMQDIDPAFQPTILCDETKASIEAGLQKLQDGANPGDIVLLYMAGHAMQRSSGAYYFLSSDYEKPNYMATSIGRGELEDVVATLVGKKTSTYVFLDTCHAAAAATHLDSTGLINSLTMAGANVFCACKGNESAIEDKSRLPNGFFTYALLEALKGGVKADENGEIPMFRFADFVIEEVQKLTNRAQHPCYQPAAQGEATLILRRTR